jgi:hypothetical protein
MERTMRQNRIRRFFYASLTLPVLLAGGCGNSASKHPADKAEKIVEEFLDAWSRGESPDKFADPEQAVQGTDPDWKAGYRLLSFLNADAKQSQEMPDHVRCRVSVSLQDPKGRKWDKEVVYDVQLGEKSVIRRASP